MRPGGGMMGGMARTHDAYNTTDSPVTVTADGHTIGGREHGKVDPDEQAVSDAVDAGLLILAGDRRSPEPPPLVLDPPPPGEPGGPDDPKGATS